MKHRIKGSSTFGRRKAQRKAMLNNIASNLIRQNRINTTIAKAKEVSRIADKLVTLGKKDTIHARRQAYKILANKDLVKKLFDDIAVRYQNRNGGYTRIVKIGYRKGDSAPVAIIEFVEEDKKFKGKAKSGKAKSIKEKINGEISEGSAFGMKRKDKKVVQNKTKLKSRPLESNKTQIKNNQIPEEKEEPEHKVKDKKSRIKKKT